MGIVVQWMTSFLEVLYRLAAAVGLPYYGVAIILLTIIIKTIIYPLTWKQMASMRKMADLQPKVKEIQKKYKDDAQKAQAAVMELYKEQNVNPMSGCLPLIIQLPIFWSLYSALLHFPYGNSGSAHFIWFNLTQKDPYFILPVLAAATTFLQTRISSPTAATDPTQKVMLYFMPLMFGYISATVPSGLALYWVTMNFVSVLQQLYINRRLARGKANEA
ncbi:Membrane insertase OXA1/ALB3/YidC [Acididesulfobacillus acetoxydans]|uniref:Membrane insertase OXA1/ALB3/YidC n=1 Tax=Acididesulfobacillus acetoxydans TaxID=1561005 RepID=A0A8S0W6G3_9FIRM|nr:YidC/Oxa1 family membrane protein insertase [Acididesulfobacillus acetoxydans]CAA7599819.1 Membrane insertase OXA1/ALB3/YidC [Acididesulfobacillus acetoxydans]CEJ07385.1 Membrane protein insertase YidC [Acididesulfobacillus acetoxydans]